MMMRFAGKVVACGLIALVTASPGTAGTMSCGTLTRLKTTYDRPSQAMITGSTAFVEVPNSRVSFKIGGRGKSCVVVTYAARMQAVSPERLWLRVVLDGKTVAEPGPLIATTNDDGGDYEAHSFTWVFPAINPGSHTVRVDYKSGGGSFVGIQQQTVVLHYR